MSTTNSSEKVSSFPLLPIVLTLTVMLGTFVYYLLWNLYQRQPIALPKFKGMKNIQDYSNKKNQSLSSGKTTPQDISGTPELPFEVSLGNGKAIFLLKHLDIQKKFLGFAISSQIETLKIKLIPQNGDPNSIEKTFTKDLRQFHIGLSSDNWYLVRIKVKGKGGKESDWSTEDLYLADKELPFSLDTLRPKEADFEKIKVKLLQAKTHQNLLVIGKIGNGKSSLINSLFSAVNDEYKEVAISSSSNSSFTSRMNAYELIDGKTTLFDLPGWEEGFRFELIPEIIKGRCEGITRDQMKGGVFEFGTPGGPAKIDAVIFVIAANSYQEDDEIHRKILEELRKAQIRCVFVVTKLDVGGKGDTMNIVRSDNYLENCTVIQKVLDIQNSFDNNIYPIINLRNGRCKENQVGYMALNILKAALNLS